MKIALFWRLMPRRIFIVKEAKTRPSFMAFKDRVAILLIVMLLVINFEPFVVWCCEGARVFKHVRSHKWIYFFSRHLWVATPVKQGHTGRYHAFQCFTFLHLCKCTRWCLHNDKITQPCGSQNVSPLLAVACLYFHHSRKSYWIALLKRMLLHEIGKCMSISVGIFSLVDHWKLIVGNTDPESSLAG